MNGIEIERVETFDFLGVTLDENLTWKPPWQSGNKTV